MNKENEISDHILEVERPRDQVRENEDRRFGQVNKTFCFV
jgi:hypothetical protein